MKTATNNKPPSTTPKRAKRKSTLPMSAADFPDRLMAIEDVVLMTSFCKSKVRKMVLLNQFPEAEKIAGWSIRWRLSVVKNWIDNPSAWIARRALEVSKSGKGLQQAA